MHRFTRSTWPCATKYDFFLFSRDHYWTLKGAEFKLIDQGYAMCLVDDGIRHGNQDRAILYRCRRQLLRTIHLRAVFPERRHPGDLKLHAKVTLGTPANPAATPVLPETPNNVNPQDLVTQINKLSNLIYAAFGASSPGQPPAIIPIQAVGERPQAAPILGPPGFNGYSLNVVGTNRQPISSRKSIPPITYAIAGSTTIVPVNTKPARRCPFMAPCRTAWINSVSLPTLQSKDLTSYIPRPTVPAGPSPASSEATGWAR